MSTRGTILNTLATQLATITTANGYNSAVFEVLRDAEHSDNMPTESVSLVIIDVGPDTPVSYFASSKILCETGVIVKARVTATSLDDTGANAATAADKIIGDMRKLILTPISLGANCRFAEIADIPEVNVSKERAIVQFNIRIVYWYTGTAP